MVLEDIDRAIGLIENGGTFITPTTEFGAETVSLLGGTDSNQLANHIQTIKANVGFDRLQAMRDASPTGGALGQVSERELAFLQSAIGSLDQSQKKEELIYNLNRVRRIYNEIIHGKEEAARLEEARLKARATSSGPVDEQQLQRLLDKYAPL